MKLLVLAFFVAAAAAAPIEDNNGPVEVIVNGVPDGEPLDIGHIVDIQLKEHSTGSVAATNLLHPFTAEGIAEVAAAAVAESEVIVPEAVILPAPVAPEVHLPEAVIPNPVVLPAPVAPEVQIPDVVVPNPVVLPAPIAPEVQIPDVVVPNPVVLPAPVAPEVQIPDVVVPNPVVLPAPVAPEVIFPVIPDPVVLPAPVAPEVAIDPVPSPAAQVSGDIYNDGTVQVSVNTQDGVVSTISSWFNMVVNYFNGGVQTSQQIV